MDSETKTQRWKCTVEYDGSKFFGWQRQEDNAPTVQGVLEDAVDLFCQQRLTIHAAGRTDAGVHAHGQVCHFNLVDRPAESAEIINALNALVRPHAVSVLTAEPVTDEFHARFSAKSKLYTYRILNRLAPPAIDRGRFWHHRRDLDVDLMREGAQYLLGHHDFTSFRDSNCQAKSPMKTLDRLDVEAVPYDVYGGREIRIHVQSRSFLHHQVRIMAGTLLMVGDHKWAPADVKTALEAKDRARGGPTAPADGLSLVSVEY